MGLEFDDEEKPTRPVAATIARAISNHHLDKLVCRALQTAQQKGEYQAELERVSPKMIQYLESAGYRASSEQNKSGRWVIRVTW